MHKITVVFSLMTLLMTACKKDELYDLKSDCKVGTSTKKVLMIGIDGCRVDALQKAETPAIDSILAHSYYSLHCDRGRHTMSVPGWSTLLHGVFAEKHKLEINNFSGNNYEQYPDVFHYLRQADSSLSLATISHWDDFLRITTNEDYAQYVDSDLILKDEAIRMMNECTPDVLLLHFDDTDHAGHFKGGFSPDNPAYIEAIEQTDEYVGLLMETVKTREQLYGEEWLVLVVTDHGGQGLGHGGQYKLDQTRFVFQMLRLPNLQQSIEITDATNANITPTILKYMGVTIDNAWGFDDEPVF